VAVVQQQQQQLQERAERKTAESVTLHHRVTQKAIGVVIELLAWQRPYVWKCKM
jgi:hypothetical protein